MAESVDDFLAGWASGAVALVVTQPLDLFITRLQSGGAAAKAAAASSPAVLWRGTWPVLLVQPVNSALLFLGYGEGVRWAEAASARRGDSVGRPHNSRRPERLGAAESRGDGPAGSPAARIDIRNDSAGFNTRPGRLHKQDGMEEDEYYRGTQKYEAAAVAALLAAEGFHTS